MSYKGKIAYANEEADKLNRIGLSALHELKKESDERPKRSEMEYKAFIFGNIPHREDWKEGDGNVEAFEKFVLENKPAHQTLEEAMAYSPK